MEIDTAREIIDGLAQDFVRDSAEEIKALNDEAGEELEIMFKKWIPGDVA